MLVRVITWPGWASLNFCSSGHFVRNDHHIEKFEKFEHSRDSPIVFPYTYGYRGAACSIPIAWGPFFESKKHIALNSTWTQYEEKNLNRHEIQRQSDLEAAPGRKLSRAIEIDSQTTPKPLKNEKIMKSRKTRQNLRIHRFFDFKYAFSLCWRSKSLRCATLVPGRE